MKSAGTGGPGTAGPASMGQSSRALLRENTLGGPAPEEGLVAGLERETTDPVTVAMAVR
jgi:hypothetical protein